MVVPFRGTLCSVILAWTAVGRLGAAEPPDVPTGWKDVEALRAPTRYLVDVEHYRFGTTDVRNPEFYPIPAGIEATAPLAYIDAGGP
jgi:hypothetical protein